MLSSKKIPLVIFSFAFIVFGLYRANEFYENQKIMTAVATNYADCENSKNGDIKACLDFFEKDLATIFKSEYVKNTEEKTANEVWPFGNKLEKNALIKGYEIVNKKRVAANLPRLAPLDKLTKGHVSSVN